MMNKKNKLTNWHKALLFFSMICFICALERLSDINTEEAIAQIINMPTFGLIFSGMTCVSMVLSERLSDINTEVRENNELNAELKNAQDGSERLSDTNTEVRENNELNAELKNAQDGKNIRIKGD